MQNNLLVKDSTFNQRVCLCESRSWSLLVFLSKQSQLKDTAKMGSAQHKSCFLKTVIRMNFSMSFYFQQGHCLSFFMNTILKSFLFNFLLPEPLYLICGILKTHLVVQRADDLRRGGGGGGSGCHCKALKENPSLNPLANFAKHRQLEKEKRNNPTIYLCSESHTGYAI